MKLVCWEPFQGREMLEDTLYPFAEAPSIDSFFPESFFPQSTGWPLSFNVQEDPKKILIRAELPGLDWKDIDVEVQDRFLVVKGKRRVKSENAWGGYHEVERREESFYHSFEIPSGVDPRRIEATYESGVLKLVLPKKGERAVRRISVRPLKVSKHFSFPLRGFKKMSSTILDFGKKMVRKKGRK